MSREARWPWSVLDLPGKSAEADIRRAYARKLKTIDQTAEADKFQALRQAYDVALRMASAKPIARQKTVRTGALPEVDARPAPLAVEAPLVIRLDAAPPADQDGPQGETRIRFQALLAALNGPDENDDAGRRIRQALQDPLTSDPSCAPAIELAIRDLVRRSIADHPPPDWPRSIDRDTLRALDDRFHWLSDFRMFRARFGYDEDLKGRLLDRAFGRVDSHRGPDIDAARRKRQSAYLDRIAMALSVPCVTGILFLVLRLENRINIFPDELVLNPFWALPVIGCVLVLALPTYRGWRILLRRVDPILGPRISKLQAISRLDRLPKDERFGHFCVVVVLSLIAVIFVHVRQDFGGVETVPLALAVFTGLVLLNVLLFRSDR
jgi:hypothetical protein